MCPAILEISPSLPRLLQVSVESAFITEAYDQPFDSLSTSICHLFSYNSQLGTKPGLILLCPHCQPCLLSQLASCLFALNAGPLFSRRPPPVSGHLG